MEITSAGSTYRASRFIVVDPPDGTGFFVGVANFTKIFINPQSSFDVIGKQHNVLTVGQLDSDFTSVKAALDSINPYITVSLTSGSQIITSDALFDITLNQTQLIGEFIPANTFFSYTDRSDGVMSSPATNTGTYSVQFIRCTPYNAYVVNVTPGIYFEDAFIIPSYTVVNGSDKFATGFLPNDPTTDFINLSLYSAITGVAITGVTSVENYAIVADSAAGCEINNCVFHDCPNDILITASVAPSLCFIYNCYDVGSYNIGITVDGTVLSSSYPAMAYINNFYTQASMAQNILICEGPNAIVTLQRFILIWFWNIRRYSGQ